MADRFEHAVRGAADVASTVTFARGLHKKGVLPRDVSVDVGWNLGLESLKINGVDCTQREQGGRFARGVGRFAGQSPIFVALAGVHFFAQTFAGLFYTDATNITVARSVDEFLELAWVNPKQRDQAWYAERVPQGDREHENSDSFTARFKAMSADSATEIANRIAQVRDQYLAVHPRAEWREAMERIIRENADKALP